MTTTVLHWWTTPNDRPLQPDDRAACGAAPIKGPCPAAQEAIECPKCREKVGA